MKLKKRTLALLALAGTALILPTGAKAQTLPSNDGDLYLQVADTADSVTGSYAVDLGNISEFTTTASLNLGNLSADLNTVFGPVENNGLTWQESDADWLVVGAIQKTSTIGPWNEGSEFITAVTSFNPSSLGSRAVRNFGSNFSGITDGDGGISGTAGSEPHSIYSLTSTDLAINPNVPSENLGANVDETFSDGFPSSLELLGGQGNGSPPGGATSSVSVIGTFSIDNSGDLTFEGIDAAAVPEPSSWALTLSGVVLFVVLRRRASLRNPASGLAA
jgi:hypothetical protein